MKNDRINVRANSNMKSDLRWLRYYLESKFCRKFSDSEVLEYVLKYVSNEGYKFTNFVKPYLDNEI